MQNFKSIGWKLFDSCCQPIWKTWFREKLVIVGILKKRLQTFFLYTLRYLREKPLVNFRKKKFSCLEKSWKKHLIFSLLQWYCPLSNKKKNAARDILHFLVQQKRVSTFFFWKGKKVCWISRLWKRIYTQRSLCLSLKSDKVNIWIKFSAQLTSPSVFFENIYGKILQ